MKSDLSDLLREWQPEVPEPGDFRRGVWSKIQSRPLAISWWERVRAVLARPGIAVGVAAVILLIAGVSANVLSRDAGPDAYLRAVNPYAMAR